MVKLAWLTDIHLDHLRPWPGKRKDFAAEVADSSDCCVITGDISSHSEIDLFDKFAEQYAKPIYFVLGNHDYWGGTFASTEAQIQRLCHKRANLLWLTGRSPQTIAPGVQLTGVDGWYDARFGSWKNSSFWMVDWNAIRDFYGMSAPEIVALCRVRANGDTMAAREKLKSTTAERVFFATHVPPYEESAMHEGQPSSRSALPWYTNRSLGLELASWSSENSARQLTTLCGHVHSPSVHQQAPNHTVLCGRSAYGAPSIARVFEL